MTNAIAVANPISVTILARFSRPALRVISLAVFLGLWEIFGRAAPAFASYPSEIVVAFYDVTVVENRLLPAFYVTLQALTLGFAVAAIGGTIIGYVMAQNRIVKTILDPYVAALYSTPRITLIPLFIMLVGIGFDLRVTMCILASIFPIIISTEAGVRSIPTELREAAASFNVGRAMTARTVVIPGAMPAVFAGLRIGVIRALVGVIVAEMTAGAAGIGHLLLVFGRFFQPHRLLGPVLFLGVVSIVMTKGLSLLERKLTPWRSFE